jgi:hypothetical protein
MAQLVRKGNICSNLTNRDCYIPPRPIQNKMVGKITREIMSLVEDTSQFSLLF